MAGVASGLFNSLFRKNAAFLSTVFLGAFAFEITFDTTMEAIWNRTNRGRLWKDIKQKYVQPAGNAGDEEDDDE